MGRTGISLLWMCLFCGFATSFSRLVNVATGKTYSQSSSYGSHPSSYAANGDTSGNYDFSNCIHTSDSDRTPWWEVNLRRKYPVSDITLWARTDYIGRLYPLTITVDGQPCVRAHSNNKGSQSVRCSKPIYGQVVRLTRDYRGWGNHISLNLCEVQIFVPSSLVQCPVGRYGPQCTSYCSDTCSGGSGSNFCYQDNGHCYACPEKYHKSSTHCVQCPSNCLNRECDSESGVCNSCASDRRWGSQCEKSCGQCANYPCNRNTGSCNGCQRGYHGDQCNSRCSTINTRCSQCSQNGQCTACSGNFRPPGCTGCNTGYHGDQCNSPCSTITSQCRECTQDGQCTACSSTNFKSPQCTDCVGGRWGNLCEQSCSWYRNCAGNTCDRNTGNCNGCKATGYYGDHCDLLCFNLADECSRCTQDGSCTACIGNFEFPGCTDCLDGFYRTGDSCTNCTWKCDKDAPCNKTTGHCAECPAGKKGDRCEQDCDNNHYGPSRCSLSCGQCKNSSHCDPVTGHCQQCEPGWSLPLCKEPCTGKTYGENCSQSCGQCKGGQACDLLTGECTVGCGPGFKSSDVFCKTKCDVGMRGENCSILCGHCQSVTACNHVTGECGTSGCSHGFTGALCLQATEEKESVVGPVVGSVLGAGLMITIGIVAVWCWRRKSKGGPGKPAAIEMSSANVNSLSDSATMSPGPNDSCNGRLRQAAPPSSLSAARTGGTICENEMELSPYSRNLYAKLADVTTPTPHSADC